MALGLARAAPEGHAKTRAARLAVGQQRSSSCSCSRIIYTCIGIISSDILLHSTPRGGHSSTANSCCRPPNISSDSEMDSPLKGPLHAGATITKVQRAPMNNPGARSSRASDEAWDTPTSLASLELQSQAVRLVGQNGTDSTPPTTTKTTHGALERESDAYGYNRTARSHSTTLPDPGRSSTLPSLVKEKRLLTETPFAFLHFPSCSAFPDSGASYLAEGRGSWTARRRTA